LEQIARFVKEHDVNLELIVIGHTDRDSELAKLGVIITGKYSEEDIGGILIQNHLAAVFISSVWPETYSYTLSQVLACRIFAIAFDLGAPPERIREARAGAVIDFNLVNNTSLLVETLLHLCEKQPSFDQNASFDIQEPWDLESYYEL
jgi:glycosyltransferase involved in cell wall biosynthesis